MFFFFFPFFLSPATSLCTPHFCPSKPGEYHIRCTYMIYTVCDKHCPLCIGGPPIYVAQAGGALTRSAQPESPTTAKQKQKKKKKTRTLLVTYITQNYRNHRERKPVIIVITHHHHPQPQPPQPPWAHHHIHGRWPSHAPCPPLPHPSPQGWWVC